MTYAMNTELIANSTCWTRRKLPLTTSAETAMAAMGTLTRLETPNSSKAAAIPANSAHVVPMLAMTSATIARPATRTP